MAAAKPQRTPEEVEDIIIRKIFLERSFASHAIAWRGFSSIDSPAISLSPVTENPTFQYLAATNAAHDEAKKIINMKDKNLRSEMEAVVKQAKKLRSYCRIHLANSELFPSREFELCWRRRVTAFAADFCGGRQGESPGSVVAAEE
ncbi:hypothetical protein SESBI_30847 [Sesbania bispinosa]|nr:hypothetical protein SESBI_30847 [Sesbania bispinosa]